jgi:hypothetical protein
VKINQMFPSKWLRVDDLRGKSHVVKITRIASHKVGPREESRWVMYFEGHSKGLILNKGNALAIAELYGDESDAWIGQEITIYPGQVKYKGQLVPSVCVRNPRPGPPPPDPDRQERM